MAFGKALSNAVAAAGGKGLGVLGKLGGAAPDALSSAVALAALAARLKPEGASAGTAAVDAAIAALRRDFATARPAARPWDADGGGLRRGLGELVPGGRIPSVRGGAFAAWRARLTPEEFARVDAVPEYGAMIVARTTRPARGADVRGDESAESTETTIWLSKPSRRGS